MRRAVWAALPLCLLALALPVRGMDAEEVLRQQEAQAGVAALEQAAAESGGSAEYGASLNEGLGELLDQGSQAVGGVLRQAARSGVLLLAVVLLCGVAETVYDSAGKAQTPAVAVAGTLAVTAVAAADVDSLLGLGMEAIDSMASFSNALLPTVAVVTAATGAVTGAAARQFAAALFSGLLIDLINGVLAPMVYGYVAAAAAGAATGNQGLKRVAALIKWAAGALLTGVALAFVSYLTVSGVVAGSADAATVKAARMAISGTIPVVGRILSDASETILASAGVLKGTVGVFGMVTILGICLLPLLKLAAHYLVYKLAAALAAAVDSGPVSALVDQLGGAFGLVLGMTGVCSLLLLIALVSSLSVTAV